MSVNTPFHTLLEVFLFTEQSETKLHHSYAERYLLRSTHPLSDLSLENDHKQTTAPSDRHRQTQTDNMAQTWQQQQTKSTREKKSLYKNLKKNYFFKNLKSAVKVSGSASDQPELWSLQKW